MTIDGAIAHAREVAKRRMAEYENHYDKDAHYYPTQCKKCAEEHIQLAEWLEELKQYRTIGTPEELQTMEEHGAGHTVDDPAQQHMLFSISDNGYIRADSCQERAAERSRYRKSR